MHLLGFTKPMSPIEKLLEICKAKDVLFVPLLTSKFHKCLHSKLKNTFLSAIETLHLLD